MRQAALASSDFACMALNPEKVAIYHITDVANLPSILADGGLHSDAVMAQRYTTVIGYDHIKERRLRELRVQCCGGRFVGAFVPFYFCPRSPMLYTINRGSTRDSPGCQATIVHLVSTVGAGIATNRAWAISNGNAGAYHTTFRSVLEALDELDWEAIWARQWQGRTNQKSAEFLIADFFPWSAVQAIGCHDAKTAARVMEMLGRGRSGPSVAVEAGWYY
jgi:hypothetical protein